MLSPDRGRVLLTSATIGLMLLHPSALEPLLEPLHPFGPQINRMDTSPVTDDLRHGNRVHPRAASHVQHREPGLQGQDLEELPRFNQFEAAFARSMGFV